MSSCKATSRTRRVIGRCALAVAIVSTWVGMAAAYVPDDRWSSTASGTTGSTGAPVTLTWSLLRDGGSIPDEGTSNLVAFLDGQFGAGAGGTNFTTRPWFHLFQDSLDRWSQLGGITFVYEPNDSGVLSGPAGTLGARGDIRIGGANIDGASGTLAYTYLPNDGDVVIDTAETSFFSTSTNNYRAFRNTLMHELGHAFGLLHVESTTERFLMEPFIDTSIDGPQLDEVRAIQGLYGDPLEKSFGGLGNDVAARASSLGSLASGGTRTIGAAARGGQEVGAAETDYVSIAHAADVDFFSFTIAAPLSVDFTLTPLGGVFNQAVEDGPQSLFNANARNDLALDVFGPNGTALLGSAASTAAGQVESIADLALTTPGQYFVRVSGATDSVQLFELELSATSLVVVPTGDFDGSGTVDGRDFLMWQRTLGASGANLPADGNDDGVVNAADLALWKQAFGQATGAASAVPEPAGASLLAAGIAGAFVRQRRRRIAMRQRRAQSPKTQS